jgi:diguanylate cyclase (GGDEF)-like protein/PAS domain S-box-containing protein
MPPVTTDRSRFATIRSHLPAATILAAGIVASLWASHMESRSLFIVVGGVLVSCLAAYTVSRARPRRNAVRPPPLEPSRDLPPGTPLEQAVFLAKRLVTNRLMSIPDGVLTIEESPFRVTINRNLAMLWKLPPEDAGPNDPTALLAALLARIEEPDRLRADIAQLERDPGSAIRREVTLNDGQIFEVNGGSLQAAPWNVAVHTSFFVFRDISARKQVERELQYANVLLQAQMEASPFGICVIDDAGHLSAFNRRMSELFPMPASVSPVATDDWLLTSFAPNVEDPVALLARIQYLKDHPGEVDVDEVIMKDGRVFEHHSAPLQTSSGTWLGHVVFYNDVTQERKAAQSLREDRDFVTALLDSLPGYFVMIDGAGRLIRWNESLRVLNGLSIEEIMGSNPFANVIEGDRERTMRSVREAIVKGFAELEFTIDSASQGPRTIRWQGRRITIDGQPQVLAVGLDVTEMHNAEALRRANEERFRLIFDAVTDGILIQDALTGQILDANERECAMFGYTRAELQQLDVWSLSVDTSPEARSLLSAIRAAKPTATAVFEWLNRAKDGHEFWVEISSRRMVIEGRDVILSLERDITDRRKQTEAIAYRDRIVHAVTQSTAELVKSTSSAAGMTALLRSVGEKLQVDRIGVMRQLFADGKALGVSVVCDWRDPGAMQTDVDAISVRLARDAGYRQAIDAYFAPLLEGQSMMTDVTTENSTIRQMLRDSKTVSNLLMPIMVDGSFWGYFSVDDTQAVRAWSPVEIDALRTFADVIGAMVTRDAKVDELHRSEEQFRTVSDTVLDAIIMIGVDGRVRYWNRAAERIFGYTAAEAQGKRIHEWLTPKRYRTEADAGFAGFVETGTGPLLGQTVELGAVRKDGVEIEIELSLNAMEVGLDRYAVGIARDITERNRTSALIERMARYDILTELPNRRLFVEALDQAIGRAKRNGQLFAVLYLDLDGFKDVNDTLGHPTGDALLQAVAARLQANVRSVDTIARFGGDEFAAIQIEIHEASDAAALAKKLVAVLSKPFEIGANTIHTGTSIGIAVYGPDSPDAVALLAHADIALYRAKADGRGTYRFYTEAMDAEVRRRVTMDVELDIAIEQGQLFLRYQPQIDVATGRIVGLESTVAWQHPERGVVEAAEFVPVAEKSGLIGKLGGWIVREAARQTRAWIDDGIAPPLVAFGVSSLQFKNSLDLEQNMASIVAAARVPPERLEIEVRESVLMDTAEQRNDVLLRLRAAGFRLAIDHFGTGHASLDELRRFHIERIRIDPTFVANLSPESTSAPIVRATLSLARELGITALADGVDSAAQFALLASWGCRQMQGRYVGLPQSSTAVAATLRSGVTNLIYAHRAP